MSLAIPGSGKSVSAMKPPESQCAVVVGVIIFVSALFCGLSSDASSPKDNGSWWVKTYGAYSENDHPLMKRTYGIFNRVLAAADKRANRLPKLVVIRKAGDPWAIALKDGSIILTQNAMEMCLGVPDKAVGDARLAFVLGHELAHLAKDDFWHTQAFESVRNFGSDEDMVRDIVALLCKTENLTNTAHAREILKKKELQADSYGLLYMVMAGYDPKAIVDSEGNDFFVEWSSQIIGKCAYSDSLHPAPDLRGLFVLANMRSVTEEIDLFHMGVRLYQLGKYEDALDFFETFNQRFPSREVYNNIGLAHYQMAMGALAANHKEVAFQYKLSTELDMTTRAGSFQGRGYESGFGEAIRYFRIACDKDSFYVPARINLSSACIMSGKYSDAIAALDDVPDVEKNGPEVLNNRAVAMYLLGPSIKVDMFRQATDELKRIANGNPEYSDAYYNLGRMCSERKRNSASKEMWKKFLDSEPESNDAYKDHVRKQLGLQPTARKTAIRSIPESFPTPPVPLGEIDTHWEKVLEGFEKRKLGLGTSEGALYSNRETRILVLDGVVELVQMALSDMDMSKLYATCGTPCRIFNEHADRKCLIYYHFAADTESGKLVRIIFF